MLNARCGKCGRKMYATNPNGMGRSPECPECHLKAIRDEAKNFTEATE